MKVLIAGAGIGGLVTALALERRGIEVRVFESAREIAPLGVGINLLPHAMAELAALGLADEIAVLGVRTAELCYFNRHGQLIVAPFSVRPLPGAPVSMPLLWKEVTPRLSMGNYTIKTAIKRMEKLKEDPCRPVLEVVPDLHGALERLLDKKRS